ncbi:outer membrane beta-barrel protein [Massilia sp. G4R7]|uniref:Outer membrane beta-barrel protein n=1 Tax=Massilia phyllostachyos TaxID=2898585 RepID=A0ABS8QBI7_9BURK|nr:outer membrane beta-barrel protein [Massilia phyllostachyos]MCD2519122.1 outer membrane beta-barrel protein [Massilia phyllostachyos]
MIKHIAAAAALLAASSAFAAQPGTLYVGADVGKTKIDDVSGRATSAGAFIGYNFHQNLAVEAGYRRMGDYDVYAAGAYGEVDLDAASLSLVGTLPLSGGFSLLGRVGYNRLEADAKVRGYGSGKAHDSGAVLGVGVGYAFTPNVSTRLELQRPGSDATNLSVGISYQF